jgi:tRNA threonylcarbamoyladenosine biosynthesis protein TsaB
MLVLGLDTCLNACSAAVVEGGRVLADRRELMARGHQERLAPLVREVMAEAGAAFDRLDRVAVTVGPGSFTGLRVGVAFAKGLGSALGVPAVGVGALEALAAGREGTVVALIDARREQAYVQVFRDGRALTAPDVLPLGAAAARVAELSAERLTFVGPGARLLAGAFPDGEIVELDGCDPAAVATIGAARPVAPLKPLYLRAPDAKLPA